MDFARRYSKTTELPIEYQEAVQWASIWFGQALQCVHFVPNATATRRLDSERSLFCARLPQLDLCRRRDGPRSVQHPPQLSRTDSLRAGQGRTWPREPDTRDQGDRVAHPRPAGRPTFPLSAVRTDDVYPRCRFGKGVLTRARTTDRIWSHVCNSANKHQRKLIERFRKRIRNDALCNALKAHVRAGYVQRQRTKQEAGESCGSGSSGSSSSCGDG